MPSVCVNSACENGGTCVPTDTPGKKKRSESGKSITSVIGGSYFCMCPVGYVGRYCETS